MFVEKVLKRLFPNVPRGQEKKAPVTLASKNPLEKVESKEVTGRITPPQTGEWLAGGGGGVQVFALESVALNLCCCSGWSPVGLVLGDHAACVTFCDWLLSWSIMFLRFIYIGTCYQYLLPFDW